MARFDQPTEPMTLGNMREVRVAGRQNIALDVPNPVRYH
jgi:hypothetical protein